MLRPLSSEEYLYDGHIWAAFELAAFFLERYRNPVYVRLPLRCGKRSGNFAKFKDTAMLDPDTRRAVVQHSMNVISFIQQIEEEIHTILEVLEIETESVPFDEDFPDPSIAE